ncbi:unnamed protein product [Boreogadus saida]
MGRRSFCLKVEGPTEQDRPPGLPTGWGSVHGSRTGSQRSGYSERLSVGSALSERLIQQLGDSQEHQRRTLSPREEHQRQDDLAREEHQRQDALAREEHQRQDALSQRRAPATRSPW